jgi:predicted ATPase
VLDDLHAADTPSLLLLQFLARELGSMRMLSSVPIATSIRSRAAVGRDARRARPRAGQPARLS